MLCWYGVVEIKIYNLWDQLFSWTKMFNFNILKKHHEFGSDNEHYIFFCKKCQCYIWRADCSELRDIL